MSAGSPARLLGRHVRRRAEDDAFPVIAAGLGQGRAIGFPFRSIPAFPRLRQPEIQHFDHAVRADFDIRGFQIAMNDPALVRRFERVRDLPRDRQRFVRPIRPRAMRSASVGPSTSSSTSAVDVSDFLQPIDGRDVRVVQRGKDLRFAFEAGQPVGIEREQVGQDLERDLPIQLGVVAR